MIVVEYRQIELDVCVVCNGVWFDAEELELLLDSVELGGEAVVRASSSSEAVRRCPSCRRSKMQKVEMGGGAGVTLDRCEACGGLWFDGGELEMVVNGLKQTEDGAGVGSFLADVLFAGGDQEEKGDEE